MTSNWKECKVENLGKIITGKTPRTSIKENYGGNIPFLTPSDDMSIKYVNKTSKSITEFGLNEVKNCLLPAGSICVSCIGSDLGKVVVTTEPTVTNQQINSIIINQEFFDVDFCYYLMVQLGKILNYHSKTSTAVPIVNKSSFSNYEISVPPLETQRKIAKVLSAIDDKIELNNSINNNLEQQAQAIYSNFIDNCDTQIIKVSDITATANTGADAIQKAPIVDYDTGVKCIRVGDMSNNRDIYQWGYSKVTDEVFKQYQLKKDDILVTRTATLGLNRLITSDLNAVYNNGLIRLTVDKSKIYPLFLYRQFQTSDFFNFISRIESETSVRPNMKINYLLGYEFEYPKIDKQKELIKLLIPLMNLIEHNSHQNNRLIQLRDTLLPKLMSGEIDVDKVEV